MPVPPGAWGSEDLVPIGNLSMDRYASRYSLRDDPEVLVPRPPLQVITLGTGSLEAVNGLDPFGQESFRADLVLDRAEEFLLLDLLDTEDPVLAARTIRSDVSAVAEVESVVQAVRSARVFLRRVR